MDTHVQPHRQREEQRGSPLLCLYCYTHSTQHTNDYTDTHVQPCRSRTACPRRSASIDAGHTPTLSSANYPQACLTLTTYVVLAYPCSHSCMSIAHSMPMLTSQTTFPHHHHQQHTHMSIAHGILVQASLTLYPMPSQRHACGGIAKSTQVSPSLMEYPC